MSQQQKHSRDSDEDDMPGKRVRLEHTDGSSYSVNVDPHNPPPSRVLHVRKLPDGISSPQLSSAISELGGVVSFVIMMPQKHQALIEMVSVSDAMTVIAHCAQHPVYLQGQQIMFNYSKSQELKRTSGEQPDEGNPAKILLFTVFNPIYPITCEVSHTSPSAYRLVSQARPLPQRRALITPHTTTSLKVRQNNDESWDYTGAVPLGPPAGGPPPPPGGHSQYGGRPDDRGRDNRGPPPSGVYDGGRHYGGPPPGQLPPPHHYDGGRGGYDMGPPPHHYNPSSPDSRGPPPQFASNNGPQGSSPVLMIYHINPQRMTCQSLFNLFCLYGNVLRVRILANRTDAALLQFDQAHAADTALANLNRAVIFGTSLEVTHSRNTYIAGAATAPIPGSPATLVDFSDSPHNRFTNQRAAMKNRISPPTRNVHFFGLGVGATEEHIRSIFTPAGIEEPESIKLFEKGGN
ncbi:hypothetical protein CAOG_007867 [Capsaspora owczarzaki ATCC 30864]|uniref:RRM domain-containing protein n=1 Tax=Capsaspora owczarzaki (strain ATCC 30864) TaxID=595528 RepID=A0A0D2X5G4_CAPO3|nr:hypothetical protein CAOG_007867 [Capsaspora owczarzaki ATCC 30864]